MGDGRRIWLYCPVLALLITDVALTLSGQPAAYWAGDYAVATESNPVVRPLLAHAPEAFLAATMIWLFALSAIILCWPSRAWGWRVAVVTAGIAALVHAVASASWLVRSGGWNWLMAVAYLAGMAELSWWCWRRAVAFAEPTLHLTGHANKASARHFAFSRVSRLLKLLFGSCIAPR